MDADFREAIQARRHLRRPAWLAALAFGLAAFAGIGGAAAMPSCDGTYAATLLQKLPTPMVVGLDILDDSPANRRMAARFLAGLREAGVAVGDKPNVVLHVTSYRLGGVGRGDEGAEQSFAELSGVGGALQREVPEVSGNPLSRQASSPRLTLFLRIEATEGQAARASWVASVQCRIAGSDDGQRAQDIGRVIGGALGQRIERQPL